jgi:hypothetical protein
MVGYKSISSLKVTVVFGRLFVPKIFTNISPGTGIFSDAAISRLTEIVRLTIWESSTTNFFG